MAAYKENLETSEGEKDKRLISRQKYIGDVVRKQIISEAQVITVYNVGTRSSEICVWRTVSDRKGVCRGYRETFAGCPLCARKYVRRQGHRDKEEETRHGSASKFVV